MERMINAIEFLMLDVSWHGRASGRFALGREKYFNEQLNVTAPEHAVGERLEALRTLIECGFVRLRIGDKIAPEPHEGDGLDLRRRLLIEITPEGGGVWESIAGPQWERYHEAYIEDDRTEAGRQCCARLFKAENRGRLEEMILYEKTVRAFDRMEVIESGVEEPWSVASWKQLPKGEWCRVEFARHETSMSIPEQNRSVYRWRLRGFNRIFCEEVISSKTWQLSVDC